MVLPREEGEPFFQDVALLPQDSDLPAETPKLLALLGGEPVATPSSVQVGLLCPAAERLRGDPQLARDLLQASTGGPVEPDRFSPELLRVRGGGSRHVDSLP
jgi:hypothetical protein